MEERQLSASECLNPAMSTTERCPTEERQKKRETEAALTLATSDGRVPDEP